MVTETLHPSLRPFAVELAGLDPAVTAALAPLLLRVLAALSSTAPNVRDADGEPDGYAGFQRRGPYERLVMSEWALFDEVPDEFLRRAANAEHFFYELERVSPKRAGVVVALFDVGGDQLGRPRLAQLATLIVLAARARARQAALLIGVLQETATTVLTWSMHALRTLQSARARDNANSDDHARWATRLAPLVEDDVDVDVEIVVVGGVESRRWPGATMVQIDDVIDVGTRALTLRVHEGDHAARTALLPLPDDATCVRVLRDPLGRRAPTPPTTTHKPKTPKAMWRIDPAQPLQVSVDGDACSRASTTARSCRARCRRRRRPRRPMGAPCGPWGP